MEKPTIQLNLVKNSNELLRYYMNNHYSKPKGFVGRNICHLIYVNNKCYGGIVGGSSLAHLPGRDEFFNLPNTYECLNGIINNIFFHIEKPYPIRNFSLHLLQKWRNIIIPLWEEKYNDKVIGFETLVELPRTGEVYKRDNWVEVGITKGFTCKRVGSIVSTDSYTGIRVWDTKNLRPKRIFTRYGKTP